jgi:hypothetical protein
MITSLDTESHNGNGLYNDKVSLFVSIRHAHTYTNDFALIWLHAGQLSGQQVEH